MSKTILQKAKEDAQELLLFTTGKKSEIRVEDFECPKEREWGDLAFATFRLTKLFQKDPTTIAKNLTLLIKEQLTFVKKRTLIRHVEARGPYVNFFIDTPRFAEMLFKKLTMQKEKFGDSKIFFGKRVVVEYGSPNTNKPLTLGHIRNIALGSSIAKLLQTQGWKVSSVEIRNDRGASICQAMIAWNRWGEGKTPKGEGMKGDHFLGQYYVRFKKESEQNPALKDEIQQCLQLWEQADPQTRKLWKKTQAWVLDGIEETYRTLGIKFDKIFYESAIYQKGVALVKKGIQERVLKHDEKGNVIAPLETLYKLPPLVLIRADGTSVYATQDIHLAHAKYKLFKFHKSLYVVGNEQNLYFQQLFAALDLLGFQHVKNCEHIAYALVNLLEGRMKSREGRVVDADELIQETQELVKKELEKREEELSSKELEKRSRMIALAAIKYYILQVDSKTTITFDPKKSITLNGRTGPYLQYMAVRIQSIFKKVPLKLSRGKINPHILKTPEEHAILILLSDFPNILSYSANRYEPSYLAKYLYELAKSFSIFYEKHKVIDESNIELSHARIHLTKKILLVLKKGLFILGIEVPERM